MTSQPKIMFREAGTALAVLAIYVLILLAPLHQAAGLQRDLARVGFAPLTSWSLCGAPVENHDGSPAEPAALKCPATGITKYDFVAVLPAVIPLVLPIVQLAVFWLAPPRSFYPSTQRHFGQSRAPPVAV